MLEGLAKFRPIIWKTLLENSRSIVLSLRRLSLKHASRATEVCCFPLSFCSVPYRGRVCPSFQANCEHIMKHRSDIDNPESLFLPQIRPRRSGPMVR